MKKNIIFLAFFSCYTVLPSSSNNWSEIVCGLSVAALAGAYVYNSAVERYDGIVRGMQSDYSNILWATPPVIQDQALNRVSLVEKFLELVDTGEISKKDLKDGCAIKSNGKNTDIVVLGETEYVTEAGPIQCQLATLRKGKVERKITVDCDLSDDSDFVFQYNRFLDSFVYNGPRYVFVWKHYLYRLLGMDHFSISTEKIINDFLGLCPARESSDPFPDRRLLESYLQTLRSRPASN